MFDQLFNDPVGYLTQIALMAVPFLYGIIFHELAHGWVALKLGDPTAKYAGRLTLNPLPHIDPLGAIAFVIVRIGWAKAVPVNPGYFKNPRQGMLLVALAGPASNFIQAFLWSLLVHWLGSMHFNGGMELTIAHLALEICFYGVFINLLLGIFNLLPVPPLDGSHILAGLLPASVARAYMSLARHTKVLIITLIALDLLSKNGLSIIPHALTLSGVLSTILIPATRFGLSILGMPSVF